MSGNNNKPLDRSTRQLCYEARDAFFSCLDGNQGNEKACARLEGTFQSSCPAAWAKHFRERRVYERQKEELEKSGYQGTRPS